MSIQRRTREISLAELSPLMEEILSRGESFELTVAGRSMLPMLLHRKSRVLLGPPRELRRGDLPLYRRTDGTYVLHRVLQAGPDGYTCCGDHQSDLERGIRREQIVAVTQAFARSKRWISCDNALYGLYWRLWVAIRPLRRLYAGGIRRLRRVISGQNVRS